MAPRKRRRSGEAAPRRVTRRPRVRLDTDARRAQLISLGMSIFADRTYDEVSIDDLAKAASISKGLLYHYFPTKRDLYLAGLRHIAGEMLAETDVSKLDVAPIERIRRGVDAYLAFVKARARAFVSLMRGGIGSDPEVVQIVEDVRSTLVERMFTDEGPLSGDDKRTALARCALRGWLGFAEAASLDWLTHGDLTQTAIRDLLVDALLPTLRLALGFSISQKW
jgi:AcrR family transcriptional regulator